MLACVREFFSTEFVRFIIVGGVAALVNFLSRIVFSIAVTYPAAIVSSYVLGMVTAYVLSRRFVFSVSGSKHRRAISYFALVNAVAVVQTLVVSLLLARLILPWVGVSAFREEIAHFVGICVPVFSSYLGHKHWTFQR